MKKQRRNYLSGTRTTRHIHLPLGFRVAKSVLFGGLAVTAAFTAFIGLTALLLFNDAADDRKRIASAAAEFDAPMERPEPSITMLETPPIQHWTATIDQLTEQPAYRGADDPQLRRILDAHVKAMGGWAAWNRVESLRLTGTITREGKEVDFCFIKKRPNQIRATVTMPVPGKEDEKLQLIRAHDGRRAWSATRVAGAHELMHREELSDEASEDLLADATVLPKLMALREKGALMSVAGSAEINGEPALQIDAVLPDSNNRFTVYLSEETLRVLRYESFEGTDQTTTHLSGYRMEGDIFVSGKTVIESEKTGTSVMTTDGVKVGVGIYRSYFQPGPGTITADL